MRRIAPVLAIAGLVVAIAVPFFWASRIPIFIGAALLVAAGLLARRPLPALIGIAAAVVLLLAPGLLNDWRNGRGIAWTVPDGERLLIAEAGTTITAGRDDPVLRARDIDTGDERWRLKLSKPSFTETLRVWRTGRTLLAVGYDDSLQAIDLDSGKVRWKAPPAETRFAGVTDGENVALTRCPTDQCQVESYSLRDGTLRWKAPVSGTGEFLGVPLPTRQLVDDIPLWPASFVVLRDDDRFEARDLATGRVVARGDEKTGLIGSVLVRADNEGAVSATDLETGRQLWSKERLDLTQTPMLRANSLAMPGGALLAEGDWLESLMVGDTLEVVDPRTGNLTERPTDLPPDIVDIASTDRPDAPPAILWNDYEGKDTDDSEVLVDGRHYLRKRVRDVALTPTEAGFESTQAPWGHGEHRVVEVYDRRSGKRLVRYLGENTTVSSAGERLVIAEGDDRDHRTVHVVAAG